ncbi:MAG: DUF3419 family protein [Gammaproteobacteria bacterium]|nr:DUF3419 family protein [Gammaproteobacteria bacterium]
MFDSILANHPHPILAWRFPSNKLLEMDFYQSLNYSLGNEDWQVEKKALQVEPDDHVLCVTASGDRPLHLLLTPCKKVVSIDVNQSQNFLLELKIATFKSFDYEKTLAFLGCNPSYERQKWYNEIAPLLSPPAQLYWARHQKQIALGIIYQGQTEKLCRLASQFVRFFRKGKNDKLLAIDNIEEQRLFIQANWDTWGFRKAFEILVHPKIFKLFSNDPGVTAYTEHADKPGRYIYEKMLSYLHNHLAKHSPLLQLLMEGKIIKEAYFPYLTAEGFETIRQRLEKIEILTTNIIDYLHQVPKNSFDCFSMSDIASYMPQSAFERLLQGIIHAAKPHARFCLREVISQRHIPDHFLTTMQRNAPLEAQLERDESNFVYRFMAGTVASDVILTYDA